MVTTRLRRARPERAHPRVPHLEQPGVVDEPVLGPARTLCGGGGHPHHPGRSSNRRPVLLGVAGGLRGCCERQTPGCRPHRPAVGGPASRARGGQLGRVLRRRRTRRQQGMAAVGVGQCQLGRLPVAGWRALPADRRPSDGRLGHRSLCTPTRRAGDEDVRPARGCTSAWIHRLAGDDHAARCRSGRRRVGQRRFACSHRRTPGDP